MFPYKAQSQPADYPAMPAVPIRAADPTMQSKCPADGRGVVKRSAAYLGNHKQDYIVVTPMCKRRPPAQAFNDQNCLPVTTNAHHTSLQCPQHTSHPTGLCSGKQGTRPPIRPNTGVIVVTPMCTKERLPLSNCSTESANKDTAKCVTAPTTVLQKRQLNPNAVAFVTPMCAEKRPPVSVGSAEGANTTDATKALRAELKTSQMSLKASHPTYPCLMCPNCTPALECFPLHCGQHTTALRQLLKLALGRQGGTAIALEMSDMAALLEADLQTANAAAKEKSIQKERDDAKALERQQEAERKEAALLKELAVRGESERALQAEKAALEKRLAEEIKAKVAAAKTHSAREVKKLKQQLNSRDTELVAAAAECQAAKTALSTKEAALTAALQINEEMTKVYEANTSLQELQKEQRESAKLRAFAASQVTKMEALRREKVAAERRAALATAEKAESVRAAAEKLQDAHRRNEDLAHALQKEREESARLKAAQAISVPQSESTRRNAMAAQQSATQAIKDETIRERTATQQLQSAHRDLAAAHEEITGLQAARDDAGQQAALATQQAAMDRTRLRAALAQAEAAEAALSAANSDNQLSRAEAGSAQGRIRTLLAEASARENTIVDLQGRLMDPTGSAADAPFTSAAPEDATQSASAPDLVPSTPATADDVNPAISASASNPSTPATAAEDATSAASEAPRESSTSLGHPRGPTLPSLPKEAPTRSVAPKGFSLMQKIAAVSKGLLNIMAADVKGWQTLQASR
ncbi:g5962 [Coccomyxa viridis]|uniref:G5962 protein n=1 Tax=Coccomyxa viridis TaxID=1274662 RepID=A0ABP1FWU1_9CHLO